MSSSSATPSGLRRARVLATSLPTVTTTVGVEEVSAYAAALGEASVASSPGDPVELATFFSRLAASVDVAGPFLRAVDASPSELLHAQQEFQYFATLRIGDHVSATSRYADYFERKDGRLRFVVVVTDFRRTEALLTRAVKTLVARRSATGAA